MKATTDLDNYSESGISPNPYERSPERLEQIRQAQEEISAQQPRSLEQSIEQFERVKSRSRQNELDRRQRS